MKKLLYILPLIILISCSVQKRKYQKGFYVSNPKQQKHVQKNVSGKQKKETENDNLISKTNTLQTYSLDIDLSASLNNKTISLAKVHLPLLTNENDSLCDILVLKNGDEVKAKVLEISPIEIKYKKCTMPEGPLYVVKKSDVFMIKYANGTKEVLKSEAAESNNTPTNNTPTNNNGPLKMHSYAILAFVFSLLGFII